MEDKSYFEPIKLKRAVKRLDYVAKWLNEEFRVKKEIKSMDMLEHTQKRGFLAKLLSMLKTGYRV